MKNRKEPSKPSAVLNEDLFSPEQPSRATRKPATRTNFDKVIFEDSEIKLLLLVFDLSSAQSGTNSVEVSFTKATNPRIWAIHSLGNDEQLFCCIRGMAQGTTRRFSHEQAPPREGRAAISDRVDGSLISLS